MTEARLDPYAVLGVARDASPTQIQHGYRRLAKRYHPDLQRSPRTTEQMQRLNQAWATLSNPARRARHDAVHVRSKGPSSAAWSDGPRPSWPATSAPRARYSPGAEPVQPPAGRPWLTVVIAAGAAIALIWLVIGAALFGGLPLPFLGLLLFAVTRTAFRRQF